MTNWSKNCGTESLKRYLCFFRALMFDYKHLKMGVILWGWMDWWTELHTTSLVTKVITDCKMLWMCWDQADKWGEPAEPKARKNIWETPSWKLTSGLRAGTFCLCNQNMFLSVLVEASHRELGFYCSTVWKNADYRRTHDQGDKKSYIISIKNNYVFVNISPDLLLAFKSQSCTCLHQKTVLHHFVQFQNLSYLVADKRWA